MKIIATALFVFGLLALTNAQTSLLYNERGKFRPDTTFSISMDQYNLWAKAELKIFLICGHDRLANNLKKEIRKKKFEKRSIISFDCDSSGVSSVSYAKDVGKEFDGDEVDDMSDLEKNVDKVLTELKDANARYFNNKLKIKGIYYISL